jgi:hypothetical protein
VHFSDAVQKEQCDIFKYLIDYVDINLYLIQLVKKASKPDSKIYKYMDDLEKELINDSKQDYEPPVIVKEPHQMLGDGMWRAEWVGNTGPHPGFVREVVGDRIQYRLVNQIQENALVADWGNAPAAQTLLTDAVWDPNGHNMW